MYPEVRAVMKSLSPEVLSILRSKMRPLLRQIIGCKNGRNRAGRNTCAAVDALDRIDEKLICFSVLSFVFFGVDAIDGTGVYTGGVLGADTGFCNDVCHDLSFSVEFFCQPNSSTQGQPLT